MKLIDDYFIIESLNSDEIKDGNIFFRALKLNEEFFYPTYRRVNNLSEFETALRDFSNSNYKFLLISSHGDFENFTLNDENVNSYDIADMNVNLKGRRIFLSTCEGGTFLNAKHFIKKGAYSVIGTSIKLKKIIAILLWPTLHLLFEKSSYKYEVNFKELDKSLKLLVKMYTIPLHYFSFIRGENNFKEYVYEVGKYRKRINHQF